MIDQCVCGRGVFKVIIEITGPLVERGLDKVVANCQGEDVDCIFFHRIRQLPVIYPVLSSGILEL